MAKKQSNKKPTAKRLCKQSYCANKTRHGHRKCSTCEKRIWRKKYPMKAAYQTLRQNARRRGITFTITFDYFQKFCYKTNYIAGKGRSSMSYSIDRDKNELGYVPGNIKVMYKGLNSAKGDKPITKKLVYDWQTKYAKVI